MPPLTIITPCVNYTRNRGPDAVKYQDQDQDLRTRRRDVIADSASYRAPSTSAVRGIGICQSADFSCVAVHGHNENSNTVCPRYFVGSKFNKSGSALK